MVKATIICNTLVQAFALPAHQIAVERYTARDLSGSRPSGNIVHAHTFAKNVAGDESTRNNELLDERLVRFELWHCLQEYLQGLETESARRIGL